MSKRLHIVAPVLALAAIWAILICSARNDTRRDADLGISTSKLTIGENALWTLPLTLFIWIGCESVLVAVHWGRNKRREEEGTGAKL